MKTTQLIALIGGLAISPFVTSAATVEANPTDPLTAADHSRVGQGTDARRITLHSQPPIKWLQPPDTSPMGLAVLDTYTYPDTDPPDPPYPPCRIILADDFRCTSPSTIDEITLWGSWIPDEFGEYWPSATFYVYIWSDVPAANGVPSHPGTLLWGDGIGPVMGTAVANPQESFFDPHQGIIGPDDNLYRYVLHPTVPPFLQLGSANCPVVYWLSVTVLPSESGWYGWKTSVEQWNDAAVWGHFAAGIEVPDWTPLYSPLTGVPLDLAFALAGEPVERPLDWGDAPAPFPTLGVSNGAQHLAGGLLMGVRLDAENDGQPDASATGDDLAGGFDDEDGVKFNTAFISGVPATVAVTCVNPCTTAAYLQAWIDFTADGDWDDAGERIITDYQVSPGLNTIGFVVPPALGTGRAYARFRLSTTKGLGYSGFAPDGEVEDYAVTLYPLKWRQPPDPSSRGVDVDNYWVALADDFLCTQSGPITDIHLWGSFVGDQLPPDGPTNMTIALTLYSDVPANPLDPSSYSHPGTDLWTRIFTPGQFTAGLCFRVPGGEWWHDPATQWWQFPGDFDCYQFDFYIDPAEAYSQVEGTIYWLGVKYVVQSGTGFTFGWKTSDQQWNDDACWLDPHAPVPIWRPLVYGDGHPLAGRSMDLSFALSGEKGLDFGDAPEPFPTVLPIGARHDITGLIMGASVDPENDGQPNATATGDDVNPATGPDDEDGVRFNAALISRVPATVDVTCVNPSGTAAYLQAWIDFNIDGDWDDAGEQIITDYPVSPGVNTIGFNVLAGLGTGRTYARFRLSTTKGLGYSGPASDGEVEDYAVTLYPLKWRQPPDLSSFGADVDNQRVALADDFRCTQSGPITDIHLWGSFYHDSLPPGGPGNLTLTLSFYADVPANPSDPQSYSHPGTRLWTKPFGPGQFTAGLCSHVPEGEWWHDPAPPQWWEHPGDFNCYQFDFYIEPAEAYSQVEGTIYWLGVKYDVQSGADFAFGWKTSDQQWNDDACWWDFSAPPPIWRPLVYGDGHPMEGKSMDLSFALSGEKAELDFGDLPDLTSQIGPGDYQTLLVNDGPRHGIGSTLRLGTLETTVDPELNGQPGAGANDDDLNGTTPDDEDGVLTALTGLTRGNPVSVKVSVFNNTGGNVTLWGWLDFNANGAVNAGETATATVASSGSPQNVNLTYPSVPLNAAASSYARFRVGTVAAEVATPTGWASNGEVEDYPVTTSAPPTAARLLHFSVVSAGVGQVQLTWSTLVENDLLGFHVDRTTGNGEWQRVTAQMIPATGWHQWPESYGFADAHAPAAESLAYRLVEVDLDGQEHVLAHATLLAAITTTIARTSDGLTLTLCGAPNSSVVVETAAHVAGPWRRLQTLTLDSGGASTATLSVDVHAPARFYRVVSESSALTP